MAVNAPRIPVRICTCVPVVCNCQTVYPSAWRWRDGFWLEWGRNTGYRWLAPEAMRAQAPEAG